MISTDRMYQNDLIMPSPGQIEPILEEQSALCSFLSRLMVESHIEENTLKVVSDNAKLPAQSRKASSKKVMSRRLSNESRWEGSTFLHKNRRESRWTSLNNENPRCAGLTYPSRGVSPTDPSSKKTLVGHSALQRRTLPDSPRLPTKTTEGMQSLPPLTTKTCGMPLPYKQFSIPKPKTGLGGKKVTV
jgi:hypothetical protein